MKHETMDMQEFKKEYIQTELGITKEKFERVFSFIDFGNVNHWFEEDRQDSDHNTLPHTEKFNIDLQKLKEFTAFFSDDQRFYYGYDPQNSGSFGFIMKAKEIFEKKRVFTKHIQKIRHRLYTENDLKTNTRIAHHDKKGIYVSIPKCNFDVEISVDAIKLAEYYDTFCLFSGDADFVHLTRFLKSKGKKIIIIKGGHIVYHLRNSADLVINAQDIKKYITVRKNR